MALSAQNISISVGYIAAETATPAAIAGSVYNVSQISFYVTDGPLSNKRTYPYFSRTCLATIDYVTTIQAALLHYNEINGGRGWTDVAIVSEVTDYTIDFAKSFEEEGRKLSPQIDVVQYRTFLFGQDNYTTELVEIKRSGARVILCLIVSERYEDFLLAADEIGLIGDDYVWVISPVTTEFTFNASIPVARGTLVPLTYIPEKSKYSECFIETWKNADPIKYPYAGDGEEPPVTTYDPFDMIMIAASAIDNLDKKQMLDGQYIHPQVWSDAIRESTFDGLTGHISFKPTGDRIGKTSIHYYDPDSNDYILASIYSPETGLEFISDVVWYSNTTDVPDLDIREPYYYWSCDDKEKGYDPTGKTIEIHTPDGSDIDDIDIDYHCDHFIDCKNLSDESVDCDANFTIIFIVFGILTGILILVGVVLFAFVLLFGIILKYMRLRIASPYFLLLLLISILIGYASNFAWFGKPHPVACGFQPWLLGLSTISMIAVLSVKNFRIWRIFRYPLKRTTITDFELFIYWVIIMIPAVIILTLWTIISTPTATMKEIDGVDHYVCATGGFTGAPGGYVFFGIFTGYSTIVLLFGAIISILSRNVPSVYNESKLLTISIYNLGFLAVVIIPIYLVIIASNPFLAWILRTCADDDTSIYSKSDWYCYY